ncbi:DNA gyrase subunit A [Vulcanimicrobium alpinum]|uniref:DNA gyrase subunit A n=1 Tax=Vulcanimicrobium alpinum TaxID=3016050 RepID=A0AAN1XSJ2_UNVUL|nr:DNA gyrase subunit A [Vulcanimicrobium alpinum]BDE05011.1 DNA gyrase subunit A [Vulcanimicrobium alpinum]
MNDDSRMSTIAVEDEMQESYLSYAMSVIASRALPDVRDGLKPVQRRILYAMREMGMDPSKQHRKCAGVIGEVLKSFHPHGDSSVYDALVRMAQDFTLRYPLIDGHGNFGSIDPDPPAAYRYTEARLARPAMEMLADIDKETVDFIPNFDNQTEEPVVLPARLPQLLVNGSSGIAVGMATNIPPHNVGEICDAITYLIDSTGKNLSDDELMDGLLDRVHGPDFPTGGVLLGCEAIRNAYKTGRGSVALRGKAEIVEDKGRYRIVISEVPFQVSVNRILESITDAYQEKRITGITALHNESNRKGMRIVVELHRSATPQVVLNQLYKQTPLQSSFAFNMLALVPVKRGGTMEHTTGTLTPLEPQVLSLKDMLGHFIDHRREVTSRRARYELRKALERAKILRGFRIALDNIDEVISIIRASATVDEAKANLMARFPVPEGGLADDIPGDLNDVIAAGLDEIQAAAIVDMRLRTLVGLERKKIEDEYEGLLVTIDDLRDLLAKPARILQVVRDETADLKKRMDDPRKTPVEALEGELAIEDIIADTEVVVTVTVGGYIKRVSVDTFRAQNRGGRGVIGIANLKKEDVVRNFFVATTHQHVLFFTNKGRAFRLRAYEIPDSTRQSRGTALVNLLQLPPGENVTAVFPVSRFDTDEYLVMVTRHGVIKKTKLDEFENVRRNGLIAIGLDDGDELLAVDLSRGDRDIILATHDGMAVHFNETDVRPMGRPARGVKAMTLAAGDEIVAMDVVEDDRREVLIVTSQAYGKRTPIDDYRHTSRGGKGVKAFAKEKEIGYVVDQILVKPDDELLMITSGNQVIRIPVSQIRRAGRSTKGVRLQRLAEGDEVIAIANLGQQSKAVEDITGEAPAV